MPENLSHMTNVICSGLACTSPVFYQLKHICPPKWSDSYPSPLDVFLSTVPRACFAEGVRPEGDSASVCSQGGLPPRQPGSSSPPVLNLEGLLAAQAWYSGLSAGHNVDTRETTYLENQLLLCLGEKSFSGEKNPCKTMPLWEVISLKGKESG